MTSEQHYRLQCKRRGGPNERLRRKDFGGPKMVPRKSGLAQNLAPRRQLRGASGRGRVKNANFTVV